MSSLLKLASRASCITNDALVQQKAPTSNRERRAHVQTRALLMTLRGEDLAQALWLLLSLLSLSLLQLLLLLLLSLVQVAVVVVVLSTRDVQTEWPLAFSL